MTILDELAAYAQERVAAAQSKMPEAVLRQQALQLVQAEEKCLTGACSGAGTSGTGDGARLPFAAALSREGVSFICECKKASPSKGIIAADFPYLQIAKEYEVAGADAISVLTEPKWFLGSDEYLQQIASQVAIPCLRKDFTVSSYQIYEAKCLGAKAVLLICSLLPAATIKNYLALCRELRLDALVEAHDEHEIEQALEAGAQIIGVNNRNLKDFSVNTENSRRLRAMVPSEVLFVAESGVTSGQDVAALAEIGVDAVLVGESLMRAPDKKAKLRELKGLA